MCFAMGPSPQPAPAPVAPPPPANFPDQVVQTAGATANARAKAAGGLASTILTGPQGLLTAPATTAPKTMLG